MWSSTSKPTPAAPPNSRRSGRQAGPITDLASALVVDGATPRRVVARAVERREHERGGVVVAGGGGGSRFAAWRIDKDGGDPIAVPGPGRVFD